MKNQILFIFTLLATSFFNPHVAWSENAALMIFGPSHDDTDWQSGLYSATCMKAAGWSVRAIDSPQPQTTGSKIASPPTFESSIAKILGSNDVQTLPSPAALPFVRSGTLALEPIANQELRDAISQAAIGLKRGDQFLLQINAHGMASGAKGMADCDYTQNEDLTKSAAKLAACDHHFLMMIGGKETGVSTKELLAAITPLRDRGVKVMVDLAHSCFGGASIKDFANQGICAHAYTTPDAPQNGCGGAESDDIIASNAGDSSAISSCRNMPDEDFNAISTKYQVSSEINLCIQRSRRQLRSVFSSAEKPSSTELFDKLRSDDKTAGQPISTDGPYWVFGNLGFLGKSGLSSTDGDEEDFAPTQATISCYPSVDVYFKSITDNIAAITKAILGANCNLGSEVKHFVSMNRKPLQKYFDAFKKTNDDLGAIDRLLNQKISPTLQQALVSASGVPALAVLKKCLSDYPYLAKACQPLTKANPPIDIASLKASVQNLNQEVPNQLIQLENSYRDQIMKLERSLYDQIKKSPSYQLCVNNHPQLKQASLACKDFQPPYMKSEPKK